MRQDKQEAIKLRKEGLSYLQISQHLNVPKSTLSYWLKNLQISRDARNKINQRAYGKSIAALVERNKAQTALAAERATEIRQSAILEARKLCNDRLFLIGTSLYWAEGYKKGALGSKWKSVDFANSDPVMIELMMRYFRKFCEIEERKFKIQIIAHCNIDINKSVEYWSNITKIPANQFIKTTVSAKPVQKQKKHGNLLTNGTIHIRINDVALFFRIIGWVEFLKSKPGA